MNFLHPASRDAEFELPDPPAPYMLEAVSTFFRQHLICSEDQLTILVLWAVYTWGYGCFSTATYLDIRSPEPQCGKTRCLELLSAFCCDPMFTTGSAAPTLMEQLISMERALEANPNVNGLHAVLLLDDSEHTFSAGERQPLVALLNSGITENAKYLCRLQQKKTFTAFFYPKAFAGNHRLPHSLAQRCIPIVLQRKKLSQSVKRLSLQRAYPQTRPLAQWIERWVAQNMRPLQIAALNPPAGIPAHWSARQQDAAEPLLHVADAIGGLWPEKARAAFRAIFGASHFSDPVQLLQDVREIFAAKNNPEHITTADLLSALTALDHRSWGAWTGKSGKLLARHLARFGIFARKIRTGPDKDLRAYLLSDFHDVWDRYLYVAEAERDYSQKLSGSVEVSGSNLSQC